jgi:ABC-type uncharacterized transport system fused permease/ATPase subunit
VLEAANEIAFEDATVVTPAGTLLVKDLSVRVRTGTNLLITGPNGSGKSSLFRVLGGLWPLVHGRIAKPGGGAGGHGLSHEIFYVPQRPYVTLGTLQEQLIYPLALPGARAATVVQQARVSRPQLARRYYPAVLLCADPFAT